MHTPTPQDDFGNAIRWADILPPMGTDPATFDAAADALLDRWECATSTYGGDTVTDCADV